MNKAEDARREFTTAAELRAYVDNNLKNENDDVFRHTAITDDMEALGFLNMLELSYNPSESPDMPHSFSQTKAGMAIRKSLATETATKAVSEGNISQMKYITGMQDYANDASGIHVLINLREKLGQDAYIMYLFGHMGNGKTDFAALLAELSKKELNYEIGSNIKSLEEKDTYIFTFGDLLQWLAQGHEVSSIREVEDLREDGKIEPAEDKLFIFDEGSNFASGYAGDAHETQEKLGKLVKLIRKVGGNLIIIGHTGKDVHPDIRRLSNDCVHKTAKKTAKFFETVEDAKGVGHKETIDHIPQTNWSYDTLEICFWDWSQVPSSKREEMGGDVTNYRKQQDMSKRNLAIVKAVVTNEHPEIEANEKGKITYEMLGDYYGISRQRISQIVDKFEKEAEELRDE